MPDEPIPDFAHKSIRDPLHGFIGLSKKEVRIIDTPLFRRLHSIKQLSHAFVAYPSAIHTRFEHSLGCAHIAGKMCDRLGIEREEKEKVRIAALLHDIGHGPFSHLFEDVVRRCNPGIEDPHERISEIMIKENRDIQEILGDTGQEVVDLLQKKRPAPASDIVSGGLDADKIDYMLRDSYHIGVAYGRFDLDRILCTLRRHPRDTSLCIDVGGKDAVESYRLGRHLLHVQVYHHHARLIADLMFLQALDAALDNGVIEAGDMKIRQGGDNSRFLDFYGTLDDNSVYDLIIRHPRAGLGKKILQNIRQRRLLKRACDFTPKELPENADARTDLMKASKKELGEAAARMATRAGLQRHEVIFHKSEIQIKLYDDDIMFQRRGKIASLSEDSPFTAVKSVVRYIVYGPEDVTIRRKIAKEAAEELGVEESAISHM